MIIARQSLLEDSLSFIRDASSKVSIAKNSILSTVTVLETLRLETKEETSKLAIEAVNEQLRQIAMLLEMVESR